MAIQAVPVSAGLLLREEIYSDNELLHKHKNFNLNNHLSLSQVSAKTMCASKASQEFNLLSGVVAWPVAASGIESNVCSISCSVSFGGDVTLVPSSVAC